MEKYDIQKGDIVQINPDHRFGKMLVVCTEPKSFGCQGYLVSPYNFHATRFKGAAYIRVEFKNFEYVGKAPWDCLQDEHDISDKNID